MNIDLLETELRKHIYYHADNCMLLKGDSMHLLKCIKSESVDLTVTSPPYNIGKEYEDILPVTDYIEWISSWTSLVYNISKPSASFWLNLGYLPLKNKAKALPIPYLIWNKISFYLIQEVVWNYGAGVAGRLFFSPRNEKLLFYVKDKNNYTFNLDEVRDKNVKYPNQKKNGKLKCNPKGKNPTDVWYIPKVTSGKNRSSIERTKHPAQFPEKLIERIVKVSSNINDIILDPFVGSGTTAVVCSRLNRNFIGIDCNEEYLHIAKNRIIRSTQQLTLGKV
ncbi:MAG: site-specific DNA-methyltransferase [Candidatus Coatesbacteria bacterium]|nr:site-specific DNA-methyltransferase [Candidatus Coatesbacteria bacterium]